jgi:hypothetical protein
MWEGFYTPTLPMGPALQSPEFLAAKERRERKEYKRALSSPGCHSERSEESSWIIVNIPCGLNPDGFFAALRMTGSGSFAGFEYSLVRWIVYALPAFFCG